ncbi:hypothetical protein ACFQ1E_12570 [Sphingomonas canadensis]|uniref:Uncharacterized protein n=1 Tax=Sphingomonas canadensis TaxID=1219257 RepID=A0ABW3H6R4_9SPHN|nr:hypothetical protein [Sphingomonas canadensis]MCW3836690.1 hypothetical protein [Sphingomonas canadensis]
MRLVATLLLIAAAGPAAIDPCTARAAAGACCKVCTKGKACGNTCIARHLNCHQPPGCACNG